MVHPISKHLEVGLKTPLRLVFFKLFLCVRKLYEAFFLLFDVFHENHNPLEPIAVSQVIATKSQQSLFRSFIKYIWTTHKFKKLARLAKLLGVKICFDFVQLAFYIGEIKIILFVPFKVFQQGQ